MGSGPSTPPSPDEAIDSQTHTGHLVRGLHSSNVYGIRRGAGGVECVNGEVSAPEEIALGCRDYQARIDWSGYNPRLPSGYDPSIYPSIRTNMQENDFEAGGGLSGTVSAPDRDDHRADSIAHDYAFDDEDPSRLDDEAAYCRAAADSHAGSHTSDDPGVVEAGFAPFKGQGSVMYSYRESSKMRFGTLNVKGSIQGAPGVSCHCVQCLVCSGVGDVHVFLCRLFVFRGTHSWLTLCGHSRLMTSMCWA